MAAAVALALSGCSDAGDPVDSAGLAGLVRADLDGDGRQDVAGVEEESGRAIARFACDDRADGLSLIEDGLMIEAVELVALGSSEPPAVLTTARTGAAGGAVSARALAFSGCGRPRKIFGYPPAGSGPARGKLVVDAIVQSEGDRVLVVERITRRGEPTCCPSLERTTRFEYRSGAFRRASTALRRLPTGQG